MRFKDKVIVVTGASSGLGWAMAHAFAEEGGAVAVLGTNRERTERSARTIVEAGGIARPFLIELGDEAAVTAGFAEIVSTLGDIDVLVNNAGIAGGNILSIVKIPTDELRRVLDINVIGPLLCARAAAESMRRKGGGSIINITSMAQYLPSGAYSLSKAALGNMTLALAAELGPDNIRVNSIAPGRMVSPHTDRKLPDEIQARFQAAQLVGRQGSDVDIARAALFLGSAEDSGFITAQTMLIDGGYLTNAPKVASGSAAALRTGNING